MTCRSEPLSASAWARREARAMARALRKRARRFRRRGAESAAGDARLERAHALRLERVARRLEQVAR
jgi:hypothetical protein